MSPAIDAADASNCLENEKGPDVSGPLEGSYAARLRSIVRSRWAAFKIYSRKVEDTMPRLHSARNVLDLMSTISPKRIPLAALRRSKPPDFDQPAHSARSAAMGSAALARRAGRNAAAAAAAASN